MLIKNEKGLSRPHGGTAVKGDNYFRTLYNQITPSIRPICCSFCDVIGSFIFVFVCDCPTVIMQVIKDLVSDLLVSFLMIINNSFLANTYQTFIFFFLINHFCPDPTTKIRQSLYNIHQLMDISIFKALLSFFKTLFKFIAFNFISMMNKDSFRF